MDAGLARRSAAARKKPDHCQQSEGGVRRRPQRHRPSSSAHQDREPTLGNGAAIRIIAPTGAPDLTSGKWQALPIVGVRYMLPELSEGSFFTGLARYDVSFAGDPSKRNISNLQIAPTLNIMLPDHWFVTFYPDPDIRINYGDPIAGQTGRLFLPMDFLVGRDLTKTITMSLEIGVPMIKDYPVYDFKTVTRLNIKF